MGAGAGAIAKKPELAADVPVFTGSSGARRVDP